MQHQLLISVLLDAMQQDCIGLGKLYGEREHLSDNTGKFFIFSNFTPIVGKNVGYVLQLM
jgi:hypothetical protein